MRRPLPSLVLTAVLTVLLALAGSGPASAKPWPDHATVKDKAGDAPPGIDLLSGTYAITNKKARWKVKVKKLTPTTFLAFEIWPLQAGWDRVVVYRENGKTVGKVYVINNEEEPTPYPVKCKKLEFSWDFGTDRVSVRAPRWCLQASNSAEPPYEFHAFSRFGGQKNGPRDALPAKDLDT